MSNAMLLTLVLILCSTLIPSGTECANILVIHAFYSGSPVLTWRTAAEYFAQNGHHIHIVRWKDTHYHQPSNNANITENVLAMDNSEGHYSFLTKEKQAAFDVPFDMLLNEGMSYGRIFWEAFKSTPMLYSACDALLSNKLFHTELRGMNFDLAIVDLVGNECSLALTHHLGLPTVGFWGMQFASGEATLTTASLSPSYAPNLMSKLTDRMTLLQRTYNFVLYLVNQGMVRVNSLMISMAIQRHIPDTPSPTTLLAELNGMLINSDHIMDYPQLLPPTFIRVGGLHIRDLKEIPEELDQWMQSSGDHGVVIFAVGYTMNTKLLSKKFMNSFMRAAGRLPQKFIVKFEGSLDYVPANVKIVSWVPQQEILAHNKTRLFVTHCGLQGVTESIFYGVPMVGMPIFFDQGDYLVKMVEHGIALRLDRYTATPNDIYQTLSRVIYDPMFKDNTIRLSYLMRDTKETPRERALNFVEYLIRHKGAPHLKIASRHLNFIQYFCLDIIAIMIFLLYTLLKISKIILSSTWSYNIGFMNINRSKIILRNIKEHKKVL